MREREPGKELADRGTLRYLWHPGTKNVFSGYGLTIYSIRPDRMVGLLMVDRPQPADPAWLQAVVDTYGECQLYPMTSTGERGLACRIARPSTLCACDRHVRLWPGAAEKRLFSQVSLLRNRDRARGCWSSWFRHGVQWIGCPWPGHGLCNGCGSR